MIYQYRCEHGHVFDVYRRVSDHQPIERCDCGCDALQLISAPVMVKAACDVHYTSPIDGTPITSHYQRLEDLKRHDCIPYDPEMKKDQHRWANESQANLEAAVEQTVYEEIGKMSSAKKAQLVKEVVNQGLTVEPVRMTPSA